MNLSNNTYMVSGVRQKMVDDAGAWLPSARGFLRRLGKQWAEKRAHAREMAELSRFNDRELWDIGLSRSDVLSIEQGTYRRD